MNNPQIQTTLDRHTMTQVKRNVKNGLYDRLCGLHIAYSNVNLCHFLMWYENVLSCGSLNEMIDRFLETLPPQFEVKHPPGSLLYHVYKDGSHVCTHTKTKEN